MTVALLQVTTFERFLTLEPVDASESSGVLDSILKSISGVPVAARVHDHLADTAADAWMSDDNQTPSLSSSSSSSSSATMYVATKSATMTGAQYLQRMGHIEHSAVFSPAEIGLMNQLLPSAKTGDWVKVAELFNQAADAAPSSRVPSEHIGRKTALQLKTQHEKSV